MSLIDSILSNTRDLIIVLSKNFTICKVSESLMQLLNIKMLTLKDQKFSDFCKNAEIKIDWDESSNTCKDLGTGTILIKGDEIPLEWRNIKTHEEGFSLLFILIINSKTDSGIANFSLREVMENLPEYIYWKDKNLIYQGCNKNVSNYLHLSSPDEIVDKTDYDFKWSEERITILKLIDKRVIEERISVATEDIIPQPDGSPRIMLTSKSPLIDKFNIVRGILGVSLDITDLKQAEEREKNALLESSKAIRAKAESEEQLRQVVMILTGSIAHDLRTPLVTLGFFGKFLADYMPMLIDTYDKANSVGLTKEEASIPPKIIEELLNLNEKIKKTVHDMHEFIDSTLKTLSKAISKNISPEDLIICSMWHCIHNILLRYPFSGQHRRLITWDQKDFKFMGNELLMIRVFFNLIKNSLEQIEKKGRGEILISTEMDDKQNIIRFKDTAGGAPTEIIDSLFSGYKTTKEKGTGIGLAFCKTIIENFGGHMTCHAVYGEYIEFTMSFPCI